ncbi:polysulfide reductase NrfD [Dokdonia sp. PRO95]|uniref:polysulfide reductase NrfD n=1 Tax=Dokdonia sp. PRO95 TaxID=1239415 RepID=UPI00135F1C34|nr:polysulfide reductase NrfD [Dokdonia sp. PRO95]
MATTNNHEEYAFINRAAGPYAWAYWLMFLSALILPLTLLVQKLASNFWYVLLVSFAMKSGIFFERFVIITTNLQSNTLSKNGDTHLIDIITSSIGMVFLQGVIITIVILGILEVSKKNSKLTDS